MMEAAIQALALAFVGLGIAVAIAGGIALSGALLMLSVGFFKNHFLEWRMVIQVMHEAHRQGTSIYKKRGDKAND